MAALAGLMLVGCAAPTPQTIIQTQVQVQTQVVVQTQVEVQTAVPANTQPAQVITATPAAVSSTTGRNFTPSGSFHEYQNVSLLLIHSGVIDML